MGIPSGVTVAGPDLSSYQGGAVDFVQLRDAGYSFVIVKCSEGTLPDGDYARNLTAAKAAGLPVGAYCFMHPNLPPQAQAQFLVQHAGSADFYMLDIEVGSGSLVSFALAAIAEIRALAPHKPIVDYSGAWFGSVTGLWTAPLAPITRDVAQYGSKPPEWRLGDFWQYSSTESVPGVPTPCDCNAYNGSLTQLRAWLGEPPPPAPSPKPPPVQGDPMWMNRGIALLPGAGGQGYQLDGWGGVHPLNGAPPAQVTGYWKGWNIARDLALNPDGSGGLVLDGFGGLHPFAAKGAAPAAPTDAAYWHGWDIVQQVVVTDWSDPNHLVGYTVDDWGGIHPFGGAPAITGAEYFADNVVP